MKWFVFGVIFGGILMIASAAFGDTTYNCRFTKTEKGTLTSEKTTKFVAIPGGCAVSDEMTIDNISASGQKCDNEIDVFIYSEKNFMNSFSSDGKKAKASADYGATNYTIECKP